jgi:hypothetical protein
MEDVSGILIFPTEYENPHIKKIRKDAHEVRITDGMKNSSLRQLRKQ